MYDRLRDPRITGPERVDVRVSEQIVPGFDDAVGVPHIRFVRIEELCLWHWNSRSSCGVHQLLAIVDGVQRLERRNNAVDVSVELTFGVISTHRVLEGVVLGTLYSAGAAVGLLGAVVLAGHAALETAAVGGLYATDPRRTRRMGAIVLVQAGYVVGGVAGLGVAGAVPASVRILVLAIVGGALLIVGVGEIERSVSVGGPMSIE